MGYLERHGVAQHRAVHPVGQQHPALVFRHAEHRLLLVELDGERQLGILLRRVAAQAETGVHAVHVDRAVGFIDGDLVRLRPFGLLAVDHQVGRVPARVALAFLLEHHHGQARVLHLDGELRFLLPVAQGVGDGLAEILHRRAAHLFHAADLDRHALGRGERRRQVEPVEVGDAPRDRRPVDGERVAGHVDDLRQQSVVHQAFAEDLALVGRRREDERREHRACLDLHVVEERQREGEGVDAVCLEVHERLARKGGLELRGAHSDLDFVALVHVGRTGDVARVVRAAFEHGAVGPVHGQHVGRLRTRGPVDGAARRGVHGERAAELAPVGKGQGDALQAFALEGRAGGVDGEAQQREQVGEGEFTAVLVPACRGAHLVVAFEAARRHVEPLRHRQRARNGGGAGRSVLGAVRVVGILRLFVGAELARKGSLGHVRRALVHKAGIARAAVAEDADGVARRPEDARRRAVDVRAAHAGAGLHRRSHARHDFHRVATGTVHQVLIGTTGQSGRSHHEEQTLVRVSVHSYRFIPFRFCLHTGFSHPSRPWREPFPFRLSQRQNFQSRRRGRSPCRDGRRNPPLSPPNVGAPLVTPGRRAHSRGNRRGGGCLVPRRGTGRHEWRPYGLTPPHPPRRNGRGGRENPKGQLRRGING